MMLYAHQPQVVVELRGKMRKIKTAITRGGGQVYAMKLTPSLCKLLKIVICQQPWPVCCPMPEA